MNLFCESLIARRYLWSKRRHPFVGVMSTVSLLGVAVGVAALMVVMAVMNGFDAELRDRIVGLRAHLTIEKQDAFGNAPALVESLKRVEGVTGASPYIEGQALLQNSDWASGILLRGVDPAAERTVSKFNEYIQSGTLSETGDGIVLGAELARRMNLAPGSKVQVLTQNLKKPMTFTVEGLFASGMYDYDANLAFLSLSNASLALGTAGAATGVSVALKDPDGARAFQHALQNKLGYPYSVRTWMDTNRTLFGALSLEKLVMFLILALIVLVACLNLAGSLTVLVMDKTAQIGVLKALGATPSMLMRIFSLDGIGLGVAGALSGLAAGGGICYVLAHTQLVSLPKEIYYLDRLPVKPQAWDVFVIAAVAVVLSWLSALYPAWTAARLSPAKALRYE